MKITLALAERGFFFVHGGRVGRLQKLSVLFKTILKGTVWTMTSDEDLKSKPDSFWREKLTPEQFEIARKGGTERPFTGIYNSSKEPGIYRCVCCDQELFDSKTKFDSGSGWPSFFDAIKKENLEVNEDRKFFMVREELVCSKCGAHLGHVFDDGPAPTGKRYCINSAALKLEKKSD